MAQRSMIALFVLAAVAGAASIPTAKPTQFALHPKFASARTNLREGHALLGGNVYTATTAQATAAHPKYYEAFLKFFDVLGQGHEIVEGAKSRLNKFLDISSETFYPTKSPTAWDGVSPTRSPTVAGGNPHTGGSGRANSIQTGSAAAPGTSLWTRPPTDSPTTSPTNAITYISKGTGKCTQMPLTAANYPIAAGWSDAVQREAEAWCSANDACVGYMKSSMWNQQPLNSTNGGQPQFCSAVTYVAGPAWLSPSQQWVYWLKP